MDALDQPLSSQEWKLLHDYMEREQPYYESMDATMMDGFFHAAAMTHRNDPPVYWLPKVWGGDLVAPLTGSQQERDRMVVMVIRHYRYVQRKLNAHPRGAIEPYNVVAFKGNGELWAVWAVGFMEGVYFYANAWAALRRTKAFKAAIAPLDLLGGQYLGEPVSGLNETADQRARVGALIPTSVGKLHALWQRRHAKSFDAVRNALGSAAVRLH